MLIPKDEQGNANGAPVTDVTSYYCQRLSPDVATSGGDTDLKQKQKVKDIVKVKDVLFCDRVLVFRRD